jgi:hypothetical protein
MTSSTLLASVTVDLNSATLQDLYTVPASRNAIVTGIVLHHFSDSGSSARFAAGWDGQDLTHDGSDNDIRLSDTPVNTTKKLDLSLDRHRVATDSYGLQSVAPIGAPTDILKINVLVPEGSALTCTVDVFGYLTDSTTGVPIAVASDLTRRQRYALEGDFGPPDPTWEHSPLGGKPGGEPAFPGTLNAIEQDQVNKWLLAVALGATVDIDNLGPAMPGYNGTAFSPTRPAAKTKILAIQAYRAAPDYKAWSAGDRECRRRQWQWFCADAHDAMEAAMAKTADPTGTGFNPISGHIPPSTS